MTLEHIQDQSPFDFITFGTSSRSFALHGVRSQNAKNNRHNSFKIIPSGFSKRKTDWNIWTKGAAEENKIFTLLLCHHQVESTFLHLKDLLKSKEKSWQVNTQPPQPGEKQNSSLVIFLMFYVSLPKILLVPFMYFYYQRLPDPARLANSCGFTLQCLY